MSREWMVQAVNAATGESKQIRVFADDQEEARLRVCDMGLVAGSAIDVEASQALVRAEAAREIAVASPPKLKRTERIGLVILAAIAVIFAAWMFVLDRPRTKESMVELPSMPVPNMGIVETPALGQVDRKYDRFEDDTIIHTRIFWDSEAYFDLHVIADGQDPRNLKWSRVFLFASADKFIVLTPTTRQELVGTGSMFRVDVADILSWARPGGKVEFRIGERDVELKDRQRDQLLQFAWAMNPRSFVRNRP